MKDLKKLAILLRALGFNVDVRQEPITFNDGTEIENTFAAADLANCHWDIWHEVEHLKYTFIAIMNVCMIRFTTPSSLMLSNRFLSITTDTENKACEGFQGTPGAFYIGCKEYHSIIEYFKF